MKSFMVIDTHRLAQFQELVKLHDLRFCGNPITLGRHSHVEVCAEHLPPGGANAFFADWVRLQTPIVEKTPSFWKRLALRVKGNLIALSPT